MIKIKGYKAMNEDMTCRGFKYEIGKTYTIEGEIEICEKGFHFCRDIASVFNYYHRFESRVFEVEADGYIEQVGDKLCCRKITIVREVKGIKLNRILYGYGYGYGNGNGNGDGDGYGKNIQKILEFMEE